MLYRPDKEIDIESNQWYTSLVFPLEAIAIVD